MRSETEPRTGLGLTRQQVAELGPFGIIRETLKICKRPPLPSVQFAIVLPVIIFVTLCQFFQHWVMHHLIPGVPHPPASPFVTAPPPPPPPPPDMHLFWLWGLVFFVAGILLFCLGVFADGANFYAVGSIFWGKNVTLADVFRALPGLWTRLFAIDVLAIVFLLSVALVSIILSIIFTKFFLSGSLLGVFLLLIGLVSIFLMFYIEILAVVANGVTCYEESFGLAAYKQAKKAMDQKWGSAMVLTLVYLVAGAIVGALEFPFLNAQSFKWTYLVGGLVVILIYSWLTQLCVISWALFYFSCTSKNDEQNLIDRMEGGYHPVRTEQI